MRPRFYESRVAVPIRSEEPVPLCKSGGAIAQLSAELREGSSQSLYCRSFSVRGSGAPVKNLSHSAFLHSTKGSHHQTMGCKHLDHSGDELRRGAIFEPYDPSQSAFRYLTKSRILCMSFGKSGSFSKSMWFLLFSMTKRAPGMLAAKNLPSESGATESSSL